MIALVIAGGETGLRGPDGVPLGHRRAGGRPVLELLAAAASTRSGGLLAIGEDDALAAWGDRPALRLAAPTRGTACTLLLACDRIAGDEALLVLTPFALLGAGALPPDRLGAALDRLAAPAAGEPDADAAVAAIAGPLPGRAGLPCDGEGVLVRAGAAEAAAAELGLYWFARAGDLFAAARAHLLADYRRDGPFPLRGALDALVRMGRRVAVRRVPDRPAAAAPPQVELAAR